MSTDFRDGKTFPRRGREPLGEFLWLARLFDKARAKRDGTQDGYIYPCPMDRGVMRRWGITPTEFTTAIHEHPADEQILAWLSARVTPDRTRSANAWLQWQKFAMDWQDAQEGVPGAVTTLVKDIGLIVLIAALIVLIEWLVKR